MLYPFFGRRKTAIYMNFGMKKEETWKFLISELSRRCGVKSTFERGGQGLKTMKRKGQSHLSQLKSLICPFWGSGMERRAR